MTILKSTTVAALLLVTTTAVDANELVALHKLGGSRLGDYYETDQNGVGRLMTSGIRVSTSGTEVKGRAFLQDGGYDDEVYEKLGPGRWRVASSVHAAAAR